MDTQLDPAASIPMADAALFRPVRAGNAFEETVERILQAIKLGVVGVGTRLPAERDLAARLAVSRATLRDALSALSESGHVQVRRGRYGGAFVTDHQPPPPDNAVDHADSVDDVVTLRAVLETGAAATAAARPLSPAERRHLRTVLDETRSGERTDYRRRDSRLHLAIAEVTGSRSLTTAVADVRSRTNALLDRIPLLEPNIGNSDEQHATIVDAILDGDADTARAAMSEHLAGTAALLRGFLSSSTGASTTMRRH